MPVMLTSYEELNAFVAALSMFKKEHFFNVRREDGDIDEWQAKTYQEAEKKSDESYADACSKQDLRNNELCEEEADILVIGYDDEEEEIILAELPIILSYQHYHGDYAEHFNQRSFV